MRLGKLFGEWKPLCTWIKIINKQNFSIDSMSQLIKKIAVSQKILMVLDEVFQKRRFFFAQVFAILSDFVAKVKSFLHEYVDVSDKTDFKRNANHLYDSLRDQNNRISFYVYTVEKVLEQRLAK